VKKKIKITFEWWINEENSTILIDHQEELERAAWTRIEEMQRDDYTSGELYYVIGDVHYNGHWELNTETLF
jgi:hypothetical protein